jgi:hypothetical protein
MALEALCLDDFEALVGGRLLRTRGRRQQDDRREHEQDLTTGGHLSFLPMLF